MLFNRVHFKRSKKAEDEDTDPNLLKKNVVLKENRRLSSDYIVGEHLGSGKFGEVKRCEEKQTGGKFAAKFVPIACDEDWESVQNEIAIMNRLRHPRLIQLYDAYSRQSEVVLVLELITGGELFERIIDESFDLNESRCIRFMNEILQGVEYIHNQGVLHLDLKPENILCLSRTSFKIKIIDFGLARFYDSKEMCVLFGTPEFVSPEVISYDPVSPAADMWSVGVICYVMLSGLSPFMGDSQGETLANIMKVTYDFNYPEFAEISEEARDFIRKLLVKDPRKRMSASECLDHPWIKKTRQMKRKGTVSKKRLKHFVYRRKWQKAVNAIIALQRMGVVLHHPEPEEDNKPSSENPPGRNSFDKMSVNSPSTSRKDSPLAQSPKSRSRGKSFKSFNRSLFGRLTTKRLPQLDNLASEESSPGPASPSSSSSSRRPSLLSKLSWNAPGSNATRNEPQAPANSNKNSPVGKSNQKENLTHKSPEMHFEKKNTNSMKSTDTKDKERKGGTNQPSSSCSPGTSTNQPATTTIKPKPKVSFNNQDGHPDDNSNLIHRTTGKSGLSTKDGGNQNKLVLAESQPSGLASQNKSAFKVELKNTNKTGAQKANTKRALPVGSSLASRIGFFSNLAANSNAKS